MLDAQPGKGQARRVRKSNKGWVNGSRGNYLENRRNPKALQADFPKKGFMLPIPEVLLFGK
jgi:ribosome assembly protein YihI (activator of Der GTPase)